MAKSMALIENGTVANMLWCSDSEPETDILINPADRPVGNGDTYSNGKFYRCGTCGFRYSDHTGGWNRAGQYYRRTGAAGESG